jgi:heme A synthase
VVEIYTIAIEVYAGLIAAVAGFHFVRRLRRPPGLDKLAWGLEIALVVRAMIAVAEIATGDKPPHLTTHIGYLISSVAILPIALAAVADERDHWTSAVLAVTVVAVLVVVIRLQMTAAGHA